MDEPARILGLLVGLVTLVAAVSTLPGAALAQGDDVVVVELVETDDSDAPYAFDPPTVTIEAGTTVRWVSTHDTFHTVTSNATGEDERGELFDESFSSEGDTFERAFPEAGTFPYHCQPHSGFMFGEVVVEGDGTGSQDIPGLQAVWPVAVSGLLAVALEARRRRA